MLSPSVHSSLCVSEELLGPSWHEGERAVPRVPFAPDSSMFNALNIE